MNTLMMLLMTTCVQGADPQPVVQSQPIPIASQDPNESGWLSRFRNGRPGLLARLRGAFSRNQQPTETILPGRMPVRAGEPPIASSPLAPSVISGPAPVIVPNASAPPSGGRILERMPSGDPSR
jgi:hypothetical protein